MIKDGYDVAQICLNGHTANSSIKHHPQFNKKFCEECGEETITTCPKCNTEIAGLYFGGMAVVFSYTPPAFCKNCGYSYPWTERRIKAVKDMLAESSELTPEEVKDTQASVEELTKNSPQSQVEATRMKRILAKVGTGTASAMRDVLVDIVSETAKKIIWPGL